MASENMDVFRDAWINQVRILTDAVDDITTIDDFLAVSETHILEDVNACVTALQNGDIETMDRTGAAIRGRCGRICGVVTAEMDNYEPGYYTERVLDTVGLLSGQILPQFATLIEKSIQGKIPDEKEFIDISRLVYEGVREIRRTVMLNRNFPDDSSEDTEVGEWTIDSGRTSTIPISSHDVETGFEDTPGIRNAREAMKKMPEQDRAKIEEQVNVFRVEKRKFDMEISKWDDNGNKCPIYIILKNQ